MKNLIKTTFLLMILSLTACKPNQEATNFNVTVKPQAAPDKTIETDQNIAVHMVFTKQAEAKSKDLQIQIHTEPKHGTLRDCTFQNLKVDCVYHPALNYFGSDEMKFRIIDGDFQADKLSVVTFIINEKPENYIPPNGGGDPTDPPTVDEVEKNCQNALAGGYIQTYQTTVNFPAAIECEFNEAGTTLAHLNAAGNGPRINSFVMARVEQAHSVQLPSAGKVCDIDFNFPVQTMQYDDEIFLLLNGFVLMSSTNYATNSGSSYYIDHGLEVNDLGLQIYNWMGGNNRLYGLHYNHAVTPKYCLGLNSSTPEYNNKCQIPPTETNGQIKLDIPQSDIIRLGYSTNNLTNISSLNFGFVSTGDNDNGDCEHSAFSFDVTVKYIP